MAVSQAPSMRRAAGRAGRRRPGRGLAGWAAGVLLTGGALFAMASPALAGPHAAQPFTPIPRFWSHQHGVRIQSLGMPALGTEMTILDGTPESRRFVAGFTRVDADGPILVGAVGFGAPRALLRWCDHIGQPVSG